MQYIFGWRLTSWLLPHALRQCNREMLTVRADLAEMQTQLPRLSVPVVMLHGDHDPLVPVENVAWLEQQLAALGKTNRFAKIILPGVNHFIPWEHPEGGGARRSQVGGNGVPITGGSVLVYGAPVSPTRLDEVNFETRRVGDRRSNFKSGRGLTGGRFAPRAK